MQENSNYRPSARVAHVRSTFSSSAGAHVVSAQLLGVVASVANRLAANGRREKEKAALRARLAREMGGYLS